MTRVQSYILARLSDDQADIKIEPTKLLRWAMRSEVPLETLKLKCFYALAYRRRPLSEAEVDALGSKATVQVMRVRERIRLFLTNPTSVESLRLHTPTHSGCHQKSTCQNAILQGFIRNLSQDDLSSDTNESDFDIFRLCYGDVLGAYACHSTWCRSQSNLDEVSSRFRMANLDEEVRRCVLGTPSPSG